MNNASIKGNEYINSCLMCYKAYQANKITLFSLDIDSIRLIQEEHDYIVYHKINELLHFLLTRTYSSDKPLTGLELAKNGFRDILGAFSLSDISLTDCLHNDLDTYEIKEDTIIEPTLLGSRLWRLDVYNSLSPYLKRGNRYTFLVGSDEMKSKLFMDNVRVFTEFLHYSKDLQDRHPYVSVHLLDYSFNEFFPKVYICIQGRPYVIFEQANVACVFSDLRAHPYYKINDSFYHNNECKIWEFHKGKALKKNFSSVKGALDYLFCISVQAKKSISKIKDEYSRIFNPKNEDVKVYYDWVKKSFCFDSETENQIFGDYIERYADDKYFCKYTSLTTLISVINSGNMRLNSIVSMNDPTETSKLMGEGCNFSDTIYGKDAILKYANYYYLTSFTKNQDELNMWRYYGDDAKGVCMVFEPINEASDRVCSVSYLNMKSNKVPRRIENFLKSLKNQGIRFSIQSYVSKYLFIKPYEYRTEKERRLLIISDEPTGFTAYSNNIVTPYIDRILPSSQEEYLRDPQKYFPLILKKIVLGPEMKNKEENVRQIKYMLEQRLPNHKNIEVEVSKIQCYRN